MNEKNQDSQRGVHWPDVQRHCMMTIWRWTNTGWLLKMLTRRGALQTCSMWVWRARTYICPHHRFTCPLHYIPPSEAGLFEVGPLIRAWLHELTIWYNDIGKKNKTRIRENRPMQNEDNDLKPLTEGNEGFERWTECDRLTEMWTQTPGY